MRAWQAFGGGLQFSLRPVPAPKADETIVRVTLAGVCGSDVAKLTKAVIPDPGYPWVPGHEIVGTDLLGGRTVAVDPLIACGDCPRCRLGEINLCPTLQMVGWHRAGGFAEYVAIPRRNLVAVPAALTAGRAVLTEPVAVAVHGVRCSVPFAPPGQLAVVGSGALAVASAAYAASLGWNVVVVARDPAKLAPLNGLLDASVLALAAASERSCDVVIDAASGGDDSSFSAALDLVRDGGVIVVQTAYYPGVKLSRDLRDPIRRALVVVGSFAFCRRGGHDDFVEGMRFLTADGRWADLFVAERFALRRLPEALDAVRRRDERRAVRAILTTAE
jgi:threonine dehydrogenase-like Zn-dependent dehydrogenase